MELKDRIAQAIGQFGVLQIGAGSGVEIFSLSIMLIRGSHRLIQDKFCLRLCTSEATGYRDLR